MEISRYNIRVYGIARDESGRVLITDERRGKYLMTKFPGGGHHLGEGLSECLIREFKEELNVDIVVGELLYINDFLQVSAFDARDQILSVYYWVDWIGQPELPISTSRFDFAHEDGDAQTFRWIHPGELEDEDLTFPIDRMVLKKLKSI